MASYCFLPTEPGHRHDYLDHVMVTRVQAAGRETDLVRAYRTERAPKRERGTLTYRVSQRFR